MSDDKGQGQEVSPPEPDGTEATTYPSRVSLDIGPDGTVGVGIGARVTTASLYAVAWGIEHARLAIVIDRHVPEGTVYIDIMPDGEPVANSGSGVDWWSMAGVAGILRLYADMRMAPFVAQSEQRAAMMRGGLVGPSGGPLT